MSNTDKKKRINKKKKNVGKSHEAEKPKNDKEVTVKTEKTEKIEKEKVEGNKKGSKKSKRKSKKNVKTSEVKNESKNSEEKKKESKKSEVKKESKQEKSEVKTEKPKNETEKKEKKPKKSKKKKNVKPSEEKTEKKKPEETKKQEEKKTQETKKKKKNEKKKDSKEEKKVGKEEEEEVMENKNVKNNSKNEKKPDPQHGQQNGSKRNNKEKIDFKVVNGYYHHPTFVSKKIISHFTDTLEIQYPNAKNEIQSSLPPSMTVEKILPKKVVVKVKDSQEYTKLILSKVLTIEDREYVVKPTYKEYKDHLSIRGLPSSIDEDTLKKYIEEIGKVEKVWFFEDLDRDEVNAVVKFSKELGNDALDYDRALIEGKHVRIMFLSGYYFNCTIDMLNKSVTAVDLVDYVKEVGEFEFIWKLSNNSVLVLFKNIDSVKSILDYNGADIFGKVVSITPNFFYKDQVKSLKRKREGGYQNGRNDRNKRVKK